MRKVIAIVLLVTVLVTAFLTFSIQSSPAPVELVSVSAKSVGAVNGKNYKRVTLKIRNRSRVNLVDAVYEIEVKVRDQWIGVDPGDGGGGMGAGKTNMQRFYVLEEAEACRLRLKYYVDYQQPISPRRHALDKLGPWAERLVWKSPRLKKWFQDELEPGEKDITFEANIPPGSSASDHPLPSTPN